MKKIPNIHPREILEEEFLKEFHISAYRLAKETKMPPTRVSEIVKGKRRITADTALLVYDDAREQIGSIAESLTEDKPVSLYYCVKNNPGTLAEICSKLANFEVPSTIDTSKREKKLSFLNITVQKCPGSPGENANHRFLIESDVILEETQDNNEDSKKEDDDIICNGLVIPTRFEEEYIHNLLKSKVPLCYDEYCIYRELCKTQPKPPPSKNTKGTSFAKLYLCSNDYDTPGRVAHVLNNLLFTKTAWQKENPSNNIVDLTYTRSYYSFNPGIHKKEFYGNIVSIDGKFGKKRNKLIKTPCISFISILPIIDRNKEWEKYMKELSDFLNQYTNTNNQATSYSLSIEDPYDIRIERIEPDKEHTNSCPETCILAKRCKSKE